LFTKTILSRGKFLLALERHINGNLTKALPSIDIFKRHKKNSLSIARGSFCGINSFGSPSAITLNQYHLYSSYSSWKPPQNQPIPSPLAHSEQKIYNMENLSPVAAYRLLIGCVSPRPIALTTTVEVAETERKSDQVNSEEKTENYILNCAPFSFFNIVSFDPPLISIAIQRNQGGEKDTLRNIEANGEFTVSIISEPFLESSNHTCGNFPPHVNEIEKSGLTTLPSTRIAPPRIAESLIQMECRLHTRPQSIINDTGKNTAELVLGKILCIHVNEGIIKKTRKTRESR